MAAIIDLVVRICFLFVSRFSISSVFVARICLVCRWNWKWYRKNVYFVDFVFFSASNVARADRNEKINVIDKEITDLYRNSISRNDDKREKNSRRHANSKFSFDFSHCKRTWQTTLLGVSHWICRHFNVHATAKCKSSIIKMRNSFNCFLLSRAFFFGNFDETNEKKIRFGSVQLVKRFVRTLCWMYFLLSHNCINCHGPFERKEIETHKCNR